MKKRNEMNPGFLWDFTHIYETRDRWEAAYKAADEAIGEIKTVQGTLGASVESLLHGLEVVAKASEKAETVYIYAMLHKSADTGDADYQAIEARAMALFVRLGSAAAFLNPEILAIPEGEAERIPRRSPAIDLPPHASGHRARARAHSGCRARKDARPLIGRLVHAQRRVPHAHGRRDGISGHRDRIRRASARNARQLQRSTAKTRIARSANRRLKTCLEPTKSSSIPRLRSTGGP